MKYLKLFFSSKWDFNKIKKKKFLLIDGNYNPFTKYYKRKDFNILYRRGEKINIRILLKCFAEMNLSSLNYFNHFIKNSSPKLILTAFDYHPIFYKLKKITKIKTLMLQKGKRSFSDNIFKNKSFIRESIKENFYVDYIFLYNKDTCNRYRKLINGKYFITGSFENNYNKIKLTKQKKEILFISNYKVDKNNQIKDNCENDNLVVSHLHKLALEKRIKFNILPKDINNKKEFHFYKNILKKKFYLLKKKNNLNSNKISGKFRYIFSTYSTLGVENLSKGGRTGFIFFKSKNNPSRFYRIGSLEKIPLKGPFWTADNKFNYKELKRVFNFVIESNDKTWKLKSKRVAKKILAYDYDNKILRSIIKKELKKTQVY